MKSHPLKVERELHGWSQAKVAEAVGEINPLATRVLNGGSDPGTGRAEKGATAIAEQIQQLATMDITRY